MTVVQVQTKERKPASIIPDPYFNFREPAVGGVLNKYINNHIYIHIHIYMYIYIYIRGKGLSRHARSLSPALPSEERGPEQLQNERPRLP